MHVADDDREQLSPLAERLRASGNLGRSELINRLFDFLLEQSLAGRSPKEIEVAQEVFGKDSGFDVGQDSSVRVHIHRLRRKLEEVYAGTAGARLTIPRGEYRLAVQAPPPADEDELPPAEPADDPAPAPAAAVSPRRPSWQVAAALLAALVVGVVLGALAWHPRLRSAADPLAETSFWAPLASSRRATFLVTGDYYLFGEAPGDAGVTRLVHEFTINSRDDLDDYLMLHPDRHGRDVDLDMHVLPVGTGYALRELVPVTDALAHKAEANRPWVISMSRLAPEAFKGSNIVYVGLLGGLGLVHDPLFEASGFTTGSNPDELIDRVTGRHYASDWQGAADDRAPRRDFAYLASLPGPLGNRILVIAGTRDAAVMQAAEIAVDKAQLDQIAAHAGKAAGFEALYEVRTLGALNLSSTLVLARPLRLDGLWRPSAPAPPRPVAPAAVKR